MDSKFVLMQVYTLRQYNRGICQTCGVELSRNTDIAQWGQPRIFYLPQWGQPQSLFFLSFERTPFFLSIGKHGFGKSSPDII
jgi:hypothetical protein